MNFATIGGQSLRYEWRPGDGMPLVLIHEMGGTLDSWSLVRDRLPGRASLAMDLRGFGLSEKPTRDISMKDHVADVIGLMDHLEIDRAHIAGCAVGGGIAIAVAHQLGVRATHLTAMAPATGVPPERRDGVLGLAAMLETRGMRGFLEADTIPDAWPDGIFDREGAGFALFRATQLSTPPASIAATYRMLADLNLETELAQLPCPATFAAGRHDKARRPELVRDIANQVQGARFQILETGHFMALQSPDLVGQLLAQSD